MTTNSLTGTEKKLVPEIISIIKDHIRPKRIILFGSRTSGTKKEYSDFDIAIEGVEMDIRKERLLKDALDEKLGIFTVDLINLDKVDQMFKKLVLEKGKIIYEQ